MINIKVSYNNQITLALKVHKTEKKLSNNEILEI